MLNPVTTVPRSQPAWGRAVLQPAIEFASTVLPVLEGEIPDRLQGVLYRNGPARLERGGQRMGHWFDGDGAVLRVQIQPGRAIATYRYVHTAGYDAETTSDRLLYANYGSTPPGPWWERFGKPIKNVANTSVLVMGDRLLALWEGGAPHALDLETLETLGEAPPEGVSPQPYSAHPKRDAASGEVYNFGIEFGRQARLHLFRHGANGRAIATAAHDLPGIPLIHDFALVGRYLVVLVPPVRLQPLPVLLQFKSLSDGLTWQPHEGTQILVFDRDTLALVSRAEAEPWFQWHFGNGAEEADGTLRLTLVRYADFQTNQYLQEVASGTTQTQAKGTYVQLRLNPHTGHVVASETLVDVGCEFPTVANACMGQPWRYSHLALHRPGGLERGDLFGVIARYDHHAQTYATLDCGDHRYPTEPLLVSDRGNSDVEQGWLLTVVYDGDRHQSEVWIVASDRLADGPICRLQLPQVVPPSFHGTWHTS